MRLYAEHPQTFLPQAGRIERLRLPGGVRVDAGVAEGDEVGVAYDPMIAKLIAHAADARARRSTGSTRALAETEVARRHDEPARSCAGSSRHPALRAGETTTAFLDEHPPLSPYPRRAARPRGAARSGSTCRRRRPHAPPDVDDAAHAHGPAGESSAAPRADAGHGDQVLAAAGDAVQPRQPLVVLEAMKMETPLVSPYEAVVKAVHVAEGDRVARRPLLVELEE